MPTPEPGVPWTSGGVDDMTSEIEARNDAAEDAAESDTEVAALQATIDAYDDLAVRYPLVVDDTTNPGVAEVIPDTIGYRVASVAGNAGITNDTNELSLLTAAHQFAADELAVGDIIWLRAGGTHTTPGGLATTLRAKADATTFFSALLPTTLAAGTRNWRLVGEYEVIDSGGPKLNGWTTLHVAGVGAVADEFPRTTRTAAAAFDVTQPIDLDLTCDHSIADPGLSMLCDRLMIFRFTAPVS